MRWCIYLLYFGHSTAWVVEGSFLRQCAGFLCKKMVFNTSCNTIGVQVLFVQENGAQCNSWICNLLYLNHYLSGNIIFVQLSVEFKHYYWKLTARVKNGTERMFSCVARQFCDGQYLQFGALTGGFSPRDICICVCICTCIYVCICICICVWIWDCIYIRICLLFKLMDSTVWGLTGGFPGVALRVTASSPQLYCALQTVPSS